jgi:hypothetical protein
MKLIRICTLAAIGFAAFGLTPQAHADWFWYHHHHHGVVVVLPPVPVPVVVVHHDYGPAYYPGSLGTDVQVALRRRGYYHGPIDGDIGPGSRAAISAYQYDHGLPVTGGIDGPLRHSLGF